MGSTKLRSFSKGFIWQLTGLIIVFILTKSYEIAITYQIIRIIMYFFYERLWKKVKWGKIK